MSSENRGKQGVESAPRQQTLAPASERAEPLTAEVAPAITAQQLLSAPARSIRPADLLALQRSVGNRAVQGLLNRRADHLGPRDANGVAEGAEASVDRAASSIGKPLPVAVRASLERSFGAELSGVRVHTSSESAEAAKAVGAKAYTVGQDIHFGTGHYAPGDSAGFHLLAHEVTHTLQSRGGTSARQTKLEVSNPADSTEIEADRAADSVVAGAALRFGGPATAIHGIDESTGPKAIDPQATPEVAPAGGKPSKSVPELHQRSTSIAVLPHVQRTIGPRTIARQIPAKKQGDQDPGYGTILGAGDEAEAKAMKTPLQIDTVSVQTDRTRVSELIADIDANKTLIGQAEKDDSELESRLAPLATNTATRAKLSIFNDKLDVSSVDTTAFAAQYRIAFADYNRLTAEATEYLSRIGAESKDPLDTVGTGFEKTTGLKIGSTQSGLLQRFRAARQNLNTAGKKMDGQLTAARGAANLLQGAIYKAKGAAAEANGQDAATKLAAVRREIDEVAAGVGKVVKICSAVAGLAGGGGETNALAIPKETGGSVDIDPSLSGLAKGGTVLTPEDPSKLALIKALGTDAGSLLGDGGGPDKIAESLVKAIGAYAEKDKISHLQQSIIKAAAEESTFKAAGDAQNFVGYQEQMDAAAKQLSVLLQAFAGAKQEMADASQALMEELNKQGKKGKDQAKGVLFLADADRFLAQVRTTISVGKNQQENLQQAANDRRALRGTTSTLEGRDNSRTQVYFRCTKITVPGKIYGTNDIYRLHKVDVTFQDSGNFGANDIVQGGPGTVEGTGSASDEVANKIKVLTMAQEQVTALQTKVQTAIGVGAPGLNA